MKTHSCTSVHTVETHTHTWQEDHFRLWCVLTLMSFLCLLPYPSLIFLIPLHSFPLPGLPRTQRKVTACCGVLWMWSHSSLCFCYLYIRTISLLSEATSVSRWLCFESPLEFPGAPVGLNHWSQIIMEASVATGCFPLRAACCFVELWSLRERVQKS